MSNSEGVGTILTSSCKNIYVDVGNQPCQAHLAKFDVLVAIRVLVTGGAEAGNPGPRTALEKQAVGHEPHWHRHPLAFVGRSTLSL
jgi:hypothetical protein